jgi:hypothetical protein
MAENSHFMYKKVVKEQDKNYMRREKQKVRWQM